MISWHPDPLEQITSSSTDNTTILQTYRDLRDNFPPISAGINYHKRFLLGGGFTEQIDDPLNKHQIEMRERVKKFNKDVSFIPEACQIETQDCFKHRREYGNIYWCYLCLYLSY